jgi:hypothetical protein
MKNYLPSLSKLLGLSLLLLSLGACSYSPNALKSSYNNLGKEYVRELKQLGDYTPQQSKQLDTFGSDIMQWHRKNRLPAYASLLENLSNKLEKSQALSDADFHAYIKLLVSYPNFYESYKNNLQLAQLANTLTDEQFIKISQRIREGSRDFTEYFQKTSWENRKRQNVSGMSDLFSYLNIDLSSTQLDILRKHSENLRDLRSAIVNDSERWNNELIDLLSRRHEAGFEKKFALHMQSDNIYKRLLKSMPVETSYNSQVSVNMYKELFASFNKQQRLMLIKQLKSISKTMKELVNNKA